MTQVEKKTRSVNVSKNLISKTVKPREYPNQNRSRDTYNTMEGS